MEGRPGAHACLPACIAPGCHCRGGGGRFPEELGLQLFPPDKMQEVPHTHTHRQPASEWKEEG